MSTAPADMGGYGLDAGMASVVSPQIASAYMVHYTGDELPDSTTSATSPIFDKWQPHESAAGTDAGNSLDRFNALDKTLKTALPWTGQAITKEDFLYNGPHNLNQLLSYIQSVNLNFYLTQEWRSMRKT